MEEHPVGNCALEMLRPVDSCHGKDIEIGRLGLDEKHLLHSYLYLAFQSLFVFICHLP